MAVKRGKLLSLSTTNSKSSSTVASDTSLRYDGLTKYQIKSSGRKPNRKKKALQSRGENGARLATHSSKDPTNTTKQALDYNPQGKRRQGRPKINWRCSTLQDLEKVGVTWQEAKAIAQKRVRWRNMVDALCS